MFRLSPHLPKIILTILLILLPPSTTQTPTIPPSGPSICAEVVLSAEQDLATVTSPGYPNLYPDDYHCEFNVTVSSPVSYGDCQQWNVLLNFRLFFKKLYLFYFLLLITLKVYTIGKETVCSACGCVEQTSESSIVIRQWKFFSVFVKKQQVTSDS